MKVPVIDLEATGRNIRTLREAKGISVSELQEMIGLAAPNTIYKWQRGLNAPTIDNLLVLAYVLDAKLEDIVSTM